MEFTAILFFATFVEGLITYFKLLKDFTEMKWAFVSLAIGIIVAFAYQLDLLATFGYTAIQPWIGYLLTGFVLGRGANYVNDIISKFSSR